MAASDVVCEYNHVRRTIGQGLIYSEPDVLQILYVIVSFLPISTITRQNDTRNPKTVKQAILLIKYESAPVLHSHTPYEKELRTVVDLFRVRTGAVLTQTRTLRNTVSRIWMQQV